MKAETLLFLKRSFPVSFELTTVAKTKVENKNPALVAEPILWLSTPLEEFCDLFLKRRVRNHYVLLNPLTAALLRFAPDQIYKVFGFPMHPHEDTQITQKT